MKKALVVLMMCISFSAFTQNIFKDLKQRNLEHQKRIEENEKMQKISYDIRNDAFRDENPGTTLSRAGDLLVAGLVIQVTTTGIGAAMLSTPKPEETGKYLIIGGAIIGTSLQVLGFSKIIRAGKQFELRLGTN